MVQSHSSWKKATAKKDDLTTTSSISSYKAIPRIHRRPDGSASLHHLRTIISLIHLRPTTRGLLALLLLQRKEREGEYYGGRRSRKTFVQLHLSLYGGVGEGGRVGCVPACWRFSPGLLLLSDSFRTSSWAHSLLFFTARFVYFATRKRVTEGARQFLRRA